MIQESLSRPKPRGLSFVVYLTYTLIHPFQGLYAYPPRTSPGFLPCSRMRALPGLESDPWKKRFGWEVCLLGLSKCQTMSSRYQRLDRLQLTFSMIVGIIIITWCQDVWLLHSHWVIISHRSVRWFKHHQAIRSDGPKVTRCYSRHFLHCPGVYVFVFCTYICILYL